MNRTEFKEYLMQHLKEYLPSDLQDAQIGFQENPKNHTVKEGIVIQKEGMTVVPILYLDWYDATHPEEACMQIASDYLKYLPQQEKLSMESILSYSLEDIKMKLISREGNESLLSSVPHLRQLDLAFVPYLEINSEMSFNVTYSYCDQKSWNPEAVVRAGMENIQKEPMEFVSMEEKLAEMSGKEMIDALPQIPKNERLYVLTNESGQFGAAQIGNPKVLKAIEQGLGESYYIFPSSVDEVLIQIESSDKNPEMLQDMVKTINETMVEPEKRLSDHIYRYSKEKGLEVYQDGRWFGQGKEVGKDRPGPKL